MFTYPFVRGPTGRGRTAAAHTHKYGTGKLPVPLADDRTFPLDLDELPRPDNGLPPFAHAARCIRQRHSVRSGPASA
ncbi:hypothetical protein QFZ66_004108 [Streptomyces sp. B4I13]|nr:hypothetical protein [Streptomyces sp. B4I13]